VAAYVGCSTLGARPIHLWAGVGAAGAERAEDRSGAPSGAGSPPSGAERSRGLME